MSFLANIFLLLFGILQGILLAIVLLRKKIYRRAYVFLVMYLVVLVLQITFKVMSKVWLTDNLGWLYALSYKFPMLYGPLVYLLSVQLLSFQKRLSWLNAGHFLPFLLQVAVIATGIVKSASLHAAVQLICISLYHILAWRLWHKNATPSKKDGVAVHRARVWWLRRFIVFSFAVCLTTVAALYLLFMSSPAWDEARWSFVLLTVFVYWVSYAALNQPEVFIGIRNEAKEEVSFGSHPEGVTNLKVLRKYQGSGLSQVESHRIVSRLNQLVCTHQPHLNPDMTIEALAELIPCQRHHLSQVLNESFGQTFYDFINHLRVNEAKSLLRDPLNQQAKIIVLAYKAGFNSISTFNEVFKKSTHQTPSQYRKEAVYECQRAK